MLFFRCLGVKKTLKIKKIQIVRPEIEVGFKKPFLSRLYFLTILPKLFIVKKGKLNIYVNSTLLPGHAGHMKIQNVWFIGIPKIKIVDAI